jgi:very-short-patch-repair endonuclease
MNWDHESLKRRGLISTGFHLPYNPNLIDLARLMRKSLTPAEKKLWKGLLKDFKYRVLRQRPIDNFIVDFYCPKMKLIIEIDGAGHFKDEGKALDKERTDILKAYGLQIIRFSDHDVIKHFSEVREKILAYCSQH